MAYDRNKIVEKIISWKGAKRGSEMHKHIIDVYNSIKPLPNGYHVSYKDPWCATTVSACFHEVGYDNLIPFSASCNDMINKAKKMGIWIENDAFIPKKADIIMYDWQDSATNYANTDCIGQADHVGIVTAVSSQYITVYEGNMGNNSIVGERRIKINGKNIRGFITPKFENVSSPANPTVTAPTTPKATARKTLEVGMKDPDVLYLHSKLFKCNYGVDKTSDYFSTLTQRCVGDFQYRHKLKIDYIVGKNTWAELEKIK